MRLCFLGFVLTIAALIPSAGLAQDGRAPTLTGAAAFGDWHADKPGIRRKITPSDMPKPFASRAVANSANEVAAPKGRLPSVPAGFTVAPFATGLEGPRLLRVAPNGDVFVAETSAGQIRVLRAGSGERAERVQVFAQDLDQPFGIAFYPPGPDPKWIYIAETNAVIRYPYAGGDLVARGKPETIVPTIAQSTGGHTTRDVAFSRDGSHMYLSVGSASNVGDDLPPEPAGGLRSWQDGHPLGAAWGDETDRADVLVFDSDGRNRRVLATGIRNCVGLALQPMTDTLWCATNERDLLGDDLVPDYVTRVRSGAFYGWPWFYIGDHEDPRRAGERPDLAGKVTIPDILIQPHSAPLQMAFYDAPPGGTASFPAAYDGDAFVALHGSWNRAKRTGYKVVRAHLEAGVPTGEYEDFMTGFVLDQGRVWGRPVGVAVARDGALLVSEDTNGTIWRVAPVGTGTAK